MECSGVLQTLCVLDLVRRYFDGVGGGVGSERSTLSQVCKHFGLKP
jgi:hypothetical protein